MSKMSDLEIERAQIRAPLLDAYTRLEIWAIRAYSVEELNTGDLINDLSAVIHDLTGLRDFLEEPEPVKEQEPLSSIANTLEELIVMVEEMKEEGSNA